MFAAFVFSLIYVRKGLAHVEWNICVFWVGVGVRGQVAGCVVSLEAPLTPASTAGGPDSLALDSAISNTPIFL